MNQFENLKYSFFDWRFFFNQHFIKTFRWIYTTLLFNGLSISNVFSNFKNGLKILIECCNYKRLFINWYKTFIMFITNKRVVTPAHLDFGDTRLVALEKFKLLGFVIDNQFHVIKRLFYLPLKLGIQFFKSFILSYFD